MAFEWFSIFAMLGMTGAVLTLAYYTRRLVRMDQLQFAPPYLGREARSMYARGVVQLTASKPNYAQALDIMLQELGREVREGRATEEKRNLIGQIKAAKKSSTDPKVFQVIYRGYIGLGRGERS